MRELNVLLPIYDIFEKTALAYTISEWVESITPLRGLSPQRRRH